MKSTIGFRPEAEKTSLWVFCCNYIKLAILWQISVKKKWLYFLKTCDFTTKVFVLEQKFFILKVLELKVAFLW